MLPFALLSPGDPQSWKVSHPSDKMDTLSNSDTLSWPISKSIR